MLAGASVCLPAGALTVGAPAPPPSRVGACSQVFPDYKERVVRHEAAHFLTGYLLVRAELLRAHPS